MIIVPETSLSDLYNRLRSQNVFICSELDALNVKDLPANSYMIRISDPSREPDRITNASKYADIRTFYFYDIDDDMSLSARMNGYSHGGINDQHVTDIIDYFNVIGNSFVVIHCAAGQCRSPAVGLALAAFRNDRLLWQIIASSAWFVPRRTVKEKLCNRLRDKGKYFTECV